MMIEAQARLGLPFDEQIYQKSTEEIWTSGITNAVLPKFMLARVTA